MKTVFARFATTGKIYSYQTAMDIKVGDDVLVESEHIIEAGVLVNASDSAAEAGTGLVLRKLTAEDKEALRHLKAEARNYIDEANKKVSRHGLMMKILDAELSFDKKKLTFYFSADGRIDFRSLVSDMAKSFDKLIRLQQVGTRDEAKFFGGIGKCGRELCCTKFLNNLESITLEMAQIQELGTAGSAKLSGCCGKLMCCLAFEADNYEMIKKKMPKMGSDFNSPQGSGKVVGYNLLESKVVVENKEGKKVEVLI